MRIGARSWMDRGRVDPCGTLAPGRYGIGSM
jgi:hypothetical protein